MKLDVSATWENVRNGQSYTYAALYTSLSVFLKRLFADCPADVAIAALHVSLAALEQGQIHEELWEGEQRCFVAMLCTGLQVPVDPYCYEFQAEGVPLFDAFLSGVLPGMTPYNHERVAVFKSLLVHFLNRELYQMPGELSVADVVYSLRERLAAGEFLVRIPPLTMLWQDYDTSYAVVQAAAELLVSEGDLVEYGRDSCYVPAVRRSWNPSPLCLPGLSAYLDWHPVSGESPSRVTVPCVPLVAAQPDVAAAFGIEPGVSVVRHLVRHGSAQKPYGVTELFYPTRLVGEALRERMASDPWLDVVEAIALREGPEKAPAVVHHRLVGRFATQPERGLLHLLPHTVVLEVQRVITAADALVLQYARTTLVAWDVALDFEDAALGSSSLSHPVRRRPTRLG